MKLKITTIALIFLGINLFGQEINTSYLMKNGEKVDENQNWDFKIVSMFSKKKNIDLLKIQTFDENEVLMKTQIIENDAKKNYQKNTEEIIYQEYNCKTLSESLLQNEEFTTTEKCVSLEGKLIFADKKCEESAKNINSGNKLSSWLGDGIKNIFEDLDQRIHYKVIFVVKPNYQITINEINNKPTNIENPQLNSYEIAVIKLIEKIPRSYFEGNLKKIAGKDAETIFQLPIVWMRSN